VPSSCPGALSCVGLVMGVAMSPYSTCQ
jgi:hypothetical protein